jgi:hypothetical protein
MQVRIPVPLAACLLALVAACPQPAAALSVDDFRRAADQLGGTELGTGVKPLSLEEFLRLSEQKGDDPGLMRYFDGLRDALYQFDMVLQGVGVDVICPVEDQPPIPTSELRRRLEVDLAEKRRRSPDFDEYIRTTSLGLVALEVLAQIHPCMDEEEQEEPPLR